MDELTPPFQVTNKRLKKMNAFNVIPVDQENYGIERWNEIKKQYELIGRTYPSRELAEIAMQGMIDMYNEENKEH